MSFKNRLKKAMEEGGFTQASLAKATGMAQSMIWKLVSGKANGTSKLVVISKALGVRPEWLGEGSGPMRDSDPIAPKGLSSSPFNPVEIYEGETKTNTWILVPDLVQSESCKAYLIQEDTGCNEVPSGTYIVVDSSEDPGNNDLVYAKSGDKSSVYRFVRGGTDNFLAVDDPRVPLTPESSLKIEGVVVFLMRGIRKRSSRDSDR